MKRTNEYLREQGLDFRLHLSSGAARNIVIVRRSRRYRSDVRHIWGSNAKSWYSIGRFYLKDFKAALQRPRSAEQSDSHRGMGWQRYNIQYDRVYRTRTNFKYPKVSEEQIDTIMGLIMLDRLSK